MRRNSLVLVAVFALGLAVGLVGSGGKRDVKNENAPNHGGHVLISYRDESGARRTEHLRRTSPDESGDLRPGEWWIEIDGKVTTAAPR